ncbi:MAG: ABC transporter permease [Candidatus Eremiobacteraeota bacterium]|nr:ABC transporter permease [Candidatus Eremiobacteraeota bacterium]
MFGNRFRALLFKEFRQMRHDRRIAFVAILAPFIQLCIFGFVLSANVTNLPLGILDESQTPESRELISALTQSEAFKLEGYYASPGALGRAITVGKLDAGVVIPYDYARSLYRHQVAQVQFLLNGTNANTAEIAQGYASEIISVDNLRTLHVLGAGGPVVLMPAFLNNPGLVGSWFMVCGVLGMLMILNGSMICSTMMIKERSAGTIDQLLMSPATTSEIIVAKIVPLFILLGIMATVSVGAIRLVFGVPFHGGLGLIVLGASLCVLSGIALGMFVATLAKNALQAQLAVFFLNPPLAALSGAFTPIEAMPKWLQPFTVPNPVANWAIIARGALVKGSTFDVLWPNFLALALFTAVLLTLSVIRYRKQLA